jgi:hypothetical protein
MSKFLIKYGVRLNTPLFKFFFTHQNFSTMVVSSYTNVPNHSLITKGSDDLIYSLGDSGVFTTLSSGTMALAYRLIELELWNNTLKTVLELYRVFIFYTLMSTQ